MKKIKITKLIGFAAGVYAAYTAISMIKQKIDEQKQREADIEAEITAIIERKFAEAESEVTAQEEECH